METNVFIPVVLAVISFFQSGSAQQAHQIKALNLHNQYRAKHHVPALKMDNQLNDVAVKCAQYYANKRNIDHECPHKNSVGENLYAGPGNSDQTAGNSITGWYNEEKLYDYNKPGYSPKTGHFTQVVWKGSQRLGFGYASNNGYTVGVAIYTPPGNFLGEREFKENVLRP